MEVKAYQQYKFDTNLEFKSHLENLFPEPTGVYLEKAKRKWYNKNVSSDFDINWDGILERIEVLNEKKEVLRERLIEANEDDKLIRETKDQEENPRKRNSNGETTKNPYLNDLKYPGSQFVEKEKEPWTLKGII